MTGVPCVVDSQLRTGYVPVAEREPLLNLLGRVIVTKGPMWDERW